MARKQITDEEVGRKEYSDMINTLYDWKDEVTEPEQVVVDAIITQVTAIRNDESKHGVFLAKIIDGYCEGIT